MTQSSSRGGINLQYAPISILPESIPVWGVCHRRFGNRVILMDRLVDDNQYPVLEEYIEMLIESNRTGGTNCIRCFELTLRSLNVVQIHTEGLDKCYTTEEAAMATCPTDESIAAGKSREIMLYSKFSFPPIFFEHGESPCLLPFAYLHNASFPVVVILFCFIVCRDQRNVRLSGCSPGILPS